MADNNKKEKTVKENFPLEELLGNYMNLSAIIAKMDRKSYRMHQTNKTMKSFVETNKSTIKLNYTGRGHAHLLQRIRFRIRESQQVKHLEFLHLSPGIPLVCSGWNGNFLKPLVTILQPRQLTIFGQFRLFQQDETEEPEMDLFKLLKDPAFNCVKDIRICGKEVERPPFHPNFNPEDIVFLDFHGLLERVTSLELEKQFRDVK